MALPPPGRRALALLLTAAGLTHLAAPEPYARIVPRRLGDPRPWVLWSGVAELACAAGLLVRRTRRAAAWATAGLFVAVFPANAQMAVTALGSPRAGLGRRAVAVGRLPLQVPLVAWAVSVARS